MLEKVRRQRDGYECTGIGWAVTHAGSDLRLLTEDEFNQEWLICTDMLPPNTLGLTQSFSVDGSLPLSLLPDVRGWAWQ